MDSLVHTKELLNGCTPHTFKAVYQLLSAGLSLDSKQTSYSIARRNLEKSIQRAFDRK